jgi:CheY-like chemotaxis protein
LRHYVFRAVTKPVLIVAEDSLWRSALAGRLQREGYVVVLARSRPEAVERMAQGAPGAVLVDLTMPEGQGRQLMSYLDRQPLLRMVPRLVAVDGLKRSRRPISGGAVFIKPIEPEHLVRVLRILFPVTPTRAAVARSRIEDVWDEGLVAALA